MKVSIVVTAFNVENFVEKALKSVFNQTYKDIEVIVVEDCSTDNTMKVITKFANKIKLVKNQVNQGAGMSRRIGIQNCTGDFVLLLDADDYLDKNYIEELVKRQQETDADIVSGGITYIHDDNDRFKAETFGTIVSEGLQKFMDYGQQKIVFLNNKIVRRSLYDVVTYSDRRFVEDTPVILPLLYYAKKVAYANTAGYYYYQRESSLCHTSSVFKHQLACAAISLDMRDFFADKEEEYKNIIPIQQFLGYIKNAFAQNPTDDEIKACMDDYIRCTKYLYTLIKL